jgi:chromosome segregation ATPase
MKPAFTALIGLALIAACTSTEDPCASANRDVSFGSLVSNSVSGSYSACLGEQRQELVRLQMEASLMDGESNRLRSLAARQSAEQRALTLRLAEANTRQAGLARDIAQSEGRLSASDQEFQAILARERALRQRIEASGTATAQSADIQAIEAEQASIRAVLAALTAP